jgi:hypothetical protein
MNPFKKIVTTVLVCCAFLSVNAQIKDSTAYKLIQDDTLPKPGNGKPPVTKKHFPLKSLLIPGAMIAYGFTSLGNDGLKKLNQEFKEDIWTEHPHKLIHADNYLMFTPALFVYGLNATGIKGKNNLRDRTMILLLSNIILNTTVFTVKKLSHQLRPDGSNYHSFPSGHTAVAFASAGFLYQEYKEVSPWYGVAGYAMATATGYLRIYNNKHWLSDVVTGAGIGIVSSKIAYWLYPKIKKSLFSDKPSATIIMPGYQNNSFGIILMHQF